MADSSNVRPTRAEIDLSALADNFRSIRSFIGQDVKYMAVVKADAYGHGATECSVRLESEGVDWFGVAIPEEGVELRQAGITRPILCLGSIWPGQERLVLDHQLTPVVYTERIARSLDAAGGSVGRTLDIHIKVDTGMGRVGLRHDEITAFIDLLGKLPSLCVAGIMTHFASAENPDENEFTARQISVFERVVEQFREAGHSPEWIDLANSPAAISHPDSRGNLVRLGGALFGLLDDIMPADAERPQLKPVLSLVSKIADIKNVPAGESLGYGRTFRTERDSRIALVPVGYADGYPRGLSNRGKVCVRGAYAPVVGRISMDWTLIDVTSIPDAAVDDEITLIGRDQVTCVTAADIARQLDTIGYEITCGISPRVPRVFI